MTAMVASTSTARNSLEKTFVGTGMDGSGTTVAAPMAVKCMAQMANTSASTESGL